MKDSRATYVHKKIFVVKGDYNPFSFSTNAREIIEKSWNALSQRRKNLFNSKLLRLIKVDDIGDKINIEAVNDIFYKDVVGLRYDHGVDPRKINSSDVFQSLSCYIFVKTLDNKVMFTERDCGDWDYALDLPGGFIQDTFEIKNMEEFARSRTVSDLSIDVSCIQNVYPVGVFDFKEILEFMAVYVVQLNLTFEEHKKVSAVEVFEVPAKYTVNLHDSYFKTRLHFAVKPILDSFLEIARA